MGRLEPTEPSTFPNHQQDMSSRAPPLPLLVAPNHKNDPTSPVTTSPPSTHQHDRSIHDDRPQGASPPPGPPSPHQPSLNTTVTIHDDQPESSSPPSPKPTSPPPQHDGIDQSTQTVPSHPLVLPETTRLGPLPDNQIVLYSPSLPPEPRQQQVKGHRDEINIESMPAVQFPLRGPAPHELPVNNQMVPADQPPPQANPQMVAVPQVLPNGTVKHQQPQKGQPQVIIVPFVGVPWTSGLFDCCQHPRNAIITTVAPCVTFGQIAEILDNGSTSCLTGALLYFFLFLVLCHWNVGVRYRRRMRGAFQLAETPVTDKIAHTLFPLCALCQEFRELNDRGYDPFLGAYLYRNFI
ncbi:hypothetical protein CRG98_018930 [Punica granatum]|uniref:Uncharacterized protein n=1 Tax=Punica granatum TaxID=22663 RepID=A0A2I0JXW4_PUNGR|nr:hypothetical protein CRG98_018930 [Punica granatum]